MPFSSKALALSIAVIILALTPTSSLTSWVESRSEIIYSGPSYSIIYKPNIFNAITGSNETRVRVEVQDKTGKPLEFLALLSGPSSRGGVEVGVMGGKGYAVKQIGWYVSEVKRILMELNSDPERSGLGMLILLSTIIEEGEEKYAAADSISIPIIPGKALGKDVIVKVKFKPIMKYKVEEKLTLSGEQLQTAPERITDYCNAPGPNFAYYCYYWRLKEVEYVSSEYAYLPIIVTYLDSKTGSSTGFIIKALEITLIRGTIDYVSFNLSLGFSYKDKISIIAPGPGYV